MVQYEFELSEKSIANLTKSLNEKSKKLQNIKPKILKRLAEYTKSQIQLYISESTPYGTDELLNDIHISEIIDDIIIVYTNNEHAIYAEYGTGIVGKNNPHPKSSDIGWTYDYNEHGEKGWIYTAKDGSVYRTRGQVAHKFMLKAHNDLIQNAMEITKQVLIEEGII